MSKIRDLKIYKRLLAYLTAGVMILSSLPALGEENTQETTNEVRQEEMIDNIGNQDEVDVQEMQEDEQMTYDEFIKITTDAFYENEFYYLDNPVELDEFQAGYLLLNFDNCKNIFYDLVKSGMFGDCEEDLFLYIFNKGSGVMNILVSSPELGWDGNSDFLHYSTKDKDKYREFKSLAREIILSKKIDNEKVRQVIKFFKESEYTVNDRIVLECSVINLLASLRLKMKRLKNYEKEIEKYMDMNRGGIPKNNYPFNENSDDIFELFGLLKKLQIDDLKEIKKIGVAVDEAYFEQLQETEVGLGAK